MSKSNVSAGRTVHPLCFHVHIYINLYNESCQSGTAVMYGQEEAARQFVVETRNTGAFCETVTQLWTEDWTVSLIKDVRQGKQKKRKQNNPQKNTRKRQQLLYEWTPQK